MGKADIAKKFFMQGANCAQAVAGAFAKETGFSEEDLFKLASGFGGGFGRRREVCGAVSGMVIIANLLYGNSGIADKSAKDAHYALIQELLKEFENQTGSIICRELLNPEDAGTVSHVSEARSAEYYRKRPCAEMVAIAAGIVERRFFS